MKAWVIGDRSGPHGLRMIERPDPRPGDRDVVVRVDAVSLNYRDVLVTQGAYHRGKPPSAATPCSDAAGVVAAVGRGVTSVRAGDRVMSLFAPDWQQGSLTRAALRTTLGSGSGTGTLAEYVLFPESGVVAVPARFSTIQASTLPCAGLTAWHALFEEAPITTASSVLTIGGGGVSVFAVQMARAAGARVVAITSSAARLERLRELGAEAGVNYREVPAWGERIRALAGGEGVDLVVEVGGAGTFDESCRAVRPGGTVALVGTLARADPASSVSLTPALLRNIRVQGTMVGSREMCDRMVRQLSAWAVEPVIDTVYPFDEAERAFEHQASGRQFGKIVIRVRATGE